LCVGITRKGEKEIEPTKDSREGRVERLRCVQKIFGRLPLVHMWVLERAARPAPWEPKRKTSCYWLAKILDSFLSRIYFPPRKHHTKRAKRPKQPCE